MESTTLMELFLLGKWAMWPLLVFSIATVAIIIERIAFIAWHNLSTKDIHTDVMQHLDSNDIDAAQEYLKECKSRKIGAQIILKGLNMSRHGENRMEKAIAKEASEKIITLERGFNLLVALGSIAPITGFLGTVSGMITAFKDIANASDVNAQLVAHGIFEALITTAFGLAIAIIAITGHNVFTHIVDKFVADVEHFSSDVVTAVVVQQEEEKLEVTA